MEVRRRAGLDETGDHGNEPKYTNAAGKRILAMLNWPVRRLRALDWAGSQPPSAASMFNRSEFYARPQDGPCCPQKIGANPTPQHGAN